jgi:hypothetical protein
MNTNERNTDARSPVNPEGFQPQQSAGVEIAMFDTAADLHDIQMMFGMSQIRLQILWDLCRSVNPDHQFYRHKMAEVAEIAQTLRKRINRRAS